MKFKRFLREAELEEEKNKIKQWLRDTAREADPAWQPGDKRVDKHFTVTDDLEIAPLYSFYYSGEENDYGAVIKELPYKFQNMDRDFTLIKSDLDSLKNFPAEVSGNVTIDDNNKLTSLVGDLKKCTSLSANNCSLHNLDGLPEVEENLSLQEADLLRSFKGAPKKLHGRFAGGFPKITSIEGLPEEAKEIIINSGRSIRSLSGIHHVVKRCERIHFSGFDVIPSVFQGHALGLLKIEGLIEVTGGHGSFSSHKFKEAMDIINEHLRNGKDIVACQAELIDKGFEEYAKL